MGSKKKDSGQRKGTGLTHIEQDGTDASVVFENQFTDSEDDTDYEKVISAVEKSNSYVLHMPEFKDRSETDVGQRADSFDKKQRSYNYLFPDVIGVKETSNKNTQKRYCPHCQTKDVLECKQDTCPSELPCTPCLSSSFQSSYTNNGDSISFCDIYNAGHLDMQFSAECKNFSSTRNPPCLLEKNKNELDLGMSGHISASLNKGLKENISSKHHGKESHKYRPASLAGEGDGPIKTDAIEKKKEKEKDRGVQSQYHKDNTVNEPLKTSICYSDSQSLAKKNLYTCLGANQESSPSSIVDSFKQLDPAQDSCTNITDSMNELNSTCQHSDTVSMNFTSENTCTQARTKQSYKEHGHSRCERADLNLDSQQRQYSTSCCDRNSERDTEFKHKLGSSVFTKYELWKESWRTVTVDSLICPNFLKGAPLNGKHLTTYESGHGRKKRGFDSKARRSPKRDRIPRTFHKRVKNTSNEEMTSQMNSEMSALFTMVKETGIDCAKVLENADCVGLPSNVCTVCGKFVDPKDVERSGKSCNVKCQSCGGQALKLNSMGKAIQNLREMVEKNNLVIRDVYPDGNCMFGTVVDQLRVRGDFTYTTQSLRKEVVDYFRKNPTAEDGTPLEMFLTSESWDEYLSRMSKDGQWGDHMVLSALAEILQTNIVIFGGKNGVTETVITPKLKGNGSSTETESKTESRSLPTIHLGHIDESHFVSLRPKNWLHELQDSSDQEIQQWKEKKAESPDRRQSIIVPVWHIDFILRNIFQLDYISSHMPHISEMQDFSGTEFAFKLVGPIRCKMAPDFKSKIEMFSPDIHLFFPNSQDKAPDCCPVLTAFQTPLDTVVQDKRFKGNLLDLLPESFSSNLSQLRLVPFSPEIWTGQTTQSSTGSVCLNAVDIECLPIEGVRQSLFNQKVIFHRVLAFQSAWPEVANEWIVRQRKSPDKDVVKSVVSQGCHVVPITSNEKQTNIIDSYITVEMIDSGELWSYSFAVAETELSKQLSSCQSCGYLLFKSLIDYFIRDPPLPASLSKSVFFYACENIEQAVWKFQPGQCLIAMLQQLGNGLAISFIPHYFIPGQNLLQSALSENIAIWSRNIKRMILQPVLSLYFVLDILDITSTEVGALFDDILEDLPKYNCHKNMARSFNESFISASGALIENLVYQGDYRHAMAAIEDIYEEMCQLLAVDMDYACAIEIVLSDLTIGYRWCFGLYIDLMKGSAVTRKLAYGYEIVHITEIFGPNFDEEMPNTVVPACFSISGGDLVFPAVCAHIISLAGKPSLVTQCLRYYIDTYSNEAGQDIVIGKGDMVNRRSKLTSLHGLYMQLLEAYMAVGKSEEFRDLMPMLEMITELQQDHNFCHYLAYAWKVLGEPDNAVGCCMCYDRHTDRHTGILQ